jgi:hypothetical protein
MTLAECCDLLQTLGQPFELTRSAQQVDCTQLIVRGTARADEVRVVGIREAVRSRACGRHHGALLKQQDGLVCAGKREHVRNRLRTFRVRDGVSSTVEQG